MVKAVLIDDDRLALKQLQYVLHEYREIEVQGVFTDPLEALEKMGGLEVNVVFLDIEMPDINGFIVAEEILNLYPGTFIVFVTAFEGYAVKAFELDAIDYVVKPLSKQRMDKTIKKIVVQAGHQGERTRRGNEVKKIAKLFEQNLNKIFVWEREKIRLLSPSDVLLFSFLERDVTVVTQQGEYTTSQTLNYWEERLIEYNFFRCHRRYLVNLEKIEKIMPMFNKTYLLKLRDYPPEVPVSRQKTQQLKQILGI